MKNANHRRWRWALFIAIATVACLAVALYWFLEVRTRIRWTEDVRLPDGRVVKLTRHQEFKGPHGFGESPTGSDYWFEFTHPTTDAVIRWNGNRDLGTVALMMQGDVPTLLLIPQYGGEFRYNCPDPSYLLFRYEKGVWQRMALSDVPFKRLRSNMTTFPGGRTATSNRAKGHLTADQTLGDFSSQEIDFHRMSEQVFDRPRACYKRPNYLLVPRN